VPAHEIDELRPAAGFSYNFSALTAATGSGRRRSGQPASRLAAAIHPFFNVVALPAVDLDLPLDSRTVLRCCGPMVRALRPEWDWSANQSSGEPAACKTVLRRR